MALPQIPVLSVGADWPVETMEIESQRIHALLDEATVGLPRAALRLSLGRAVTGARSPPPRPPCSMRGGGERRAPPLR